jgi:hypothetical protein
VAFVLVLLVLVVVAVLVGLASIRRRYAQSNQVVPGTSTTAPAEWAGAHTPEALLHRRLRDAVTALRANPDLDTAGLLEARVTLEQHALTVDQRLVAVAALPERVRAEPMASVTAAVDSLEQAVASLASARAGADDHALAGVLEAAVRDVTERVALLAQARAELEEPPPGA